MSFRPYFETTPVPASTTTPGLVKGDGNTISIAPDGTISVVGVTVTALTDAGALTLSDKDTINRSGTDYSTTQTSRAALFRKTPAGSRTAALPVTLTATDHDKNIILTGTTGALSVDATVGDGFRAHLINTASGAATYSGITGLMATTSLASGASCTVMVAGTTAYATAAATVTPATAYTTALSAASGATNVPVTVSFTPNGSWQSGQTITPTMTTLAGTFATVSNGTLASGVITPVAGGATAVTVQFTPSSAAGSSGALNSTPSAGLTNTTGAVPYSVVAPVATAFTMTESPAAGLTNTATTLTIAPTGGIWPSGTTITLAQTGTTGTFANGTGGTLAGAVLTPSPGTTTSCTVTFTPSTAGSAVISATNSVSLANPPNLTYTATKAATAFTFTVNEANPATITVTPTSGAWPAGITLTPTIGSGGTLTGTFSVVTAAIAGSSAAAVVNLVPTSANGTSGSITIASNPSLTNSTGTATYTVVSYPAITTTGVTRLAIFDSTVASSLLNASGTQITSGNLSTWTEATGNGKTLVSVASNSGFPILQQNARNSLPLINMANGTAGLSTSSSWTTAMNSGGVIATVINLNSGAGGFVYTGSASTGARLCFSTTGSAWTVQKQATGGAAEGPTNNAGSLPPTWLKLVVRFTPGASGTIDTWVNGGSKVSVAGTSDAYVIDSFLLGAPAGDSASVGEIQFYAGVPSDTDCGTTLMNYLTSKWGS